MGFLKVSINSDDKEYPVLINGWQNGLTGKSIVLDDDGVAVNVDTDGKYEFEDVWVPGEDLEESDSQDPVEVRFQNG